MRAFFRNAVQRWAKRENAALGRFVQGKTPETRLEGLSKSLRYEAMLFLVALLPAVIVGPFIGKWSDAGTHGKIALAAVAMWGAFFLIAGCMFVFRGLARLSRRSRR